MSFKDIALPLAARGVPVVPVEPQSKRCRLAGWPALATTDPARILEWDAQLPSANVASVASSAPGGLVILDCDVPSLPDRIAREAGHPLPDTFTVRSGGKQLPHYYFSHTPRSRQLGNRKLAGAFDLRASNAYVVGPGSVISTPSGPRTYDIVRDAPFASFPDWLADWVEKNSDAPKETCAGAPAASEDFDIHAFLDHYNLAYTQHGNWYITEVCPVAGRRHEQSTRTGFYYDGRSFGFNCFAGSCRGNGMAVGDVIRQLNREHTPFTGPIWPDDSVPKTDPDVLRDAWFVSADDFLDREIPPREILVEDNETGSPVLFKESVNQIFAYRGLGKSLFANSLIRILCNGGEFLRYRSKGEFKVLLCDGELPDPQLQERVRQFIGKTGGRLTLMHSGGMASRAFPSLSNKDYQREFVQRLEALKPDVIVFDTLTACFRFDTNDADDWENVNQFYITLRNMGYCVIIVHHAGKNGTQRGRTDGDDNLDLAIKLSPQKGWEPGDGCKFNLSYEKVRAGSRLTEFSAELDAQSNWIFSPEMDEEKCEIINLLMQGKTTRQVAAKLGVSESTVERTKRRAKDNGQVFPKGRKNEEPGSDPE